MAAPVGRRLKVLIAVAAMVAGYLVLVPPQGATVEPAVADHAVAPASYSSNRAAKPAAAGSPRHLAATATGERRLVTDTVAAALFSVQSWYVAPPAPPPQPVVRQVPAPPTAPPLPFTFMGSFLSQDGVPTYFLTAGDRVYDVKVGDTLDNTYSVDGLKSGQLLLTYIPLKIQQSLAVGDE